MRLYQKLFLYFFILLLLMVVTVIIVQYERERNDRAQVLNEQLHSYNIMVYNYIENHSKNWNDLDDFFTLFPNSNMRITVMIPNGKVIFDSYVSENTQLENHKNRPEFLQAAKTENGIAIRHSATTGVDYYYYASKFPDYYVRSAMPYNVELQQTLRTNLFFLFFMIGILFLASLVLYFITRNFTKSIDRMRIFTERAKNNEILQQDVDFPKDELGEISSNMVTLYRQLAKTKDAVNGEREKLINHLYISQEGLGIFSQQKREILANSTFIQYTSFLLDKNEITSEEIFDLPEFDKINTFIEESFENRQMHRKKITIEKNGRYFYVQCIVFQDNTFEVSINDISAQERENEFKQQLTQNISHELKTPVSTIMGYMESILDNPDLPKEREKFFIERSFQQAQRLSALLQDIATLNKLDEKKRVYEKEECNLFEVLKDVLNDVHLEIEEKGFIVTQNLHIGIVIKGNISLLYSIFRNLIDNALSYAGENVCIDINIYREDDRFYYFTFSDNGNGVSDEHLNKLFERFYRVDKGRSRKMGGTGLGLAIVKNAIRYHKGKISAKQTPGGGLTFVFSLKKH